MFYRQLRRFIAITLSLTLCLSFLLLSTRSALAYSLEGGKWYGTPNSGCCAKIGLQFNSFAQGYDRTGITNGANAWSGSPANMYFAFGTGALTTQDTYNSSAGFDGITYYSISGGYLSYAHVYLNWYYTQNYSTFTIQGVAAHELGHALGLGHTNGCVLMTPYTSTRNSCGIDTPQSDDVNGINALY